MKLNIWNCSFIQKHQHQNQLISLNSGGIYPLIRLAIINNIFSLIKRIRNNLLGYFVLHAAPVHPRTYIAHHQYDNPLWGEIIAFANSIKDVCSFDKWNPISGGIIWKSFFRIFYLNGVFLHWSSSINIYTNKNKMRKLKRKKN